MRWVVYDPPHLTDHLTKVRAVTQSRSVCAECGLEGWDFKCSECGSSTGLFPGFAGYGDAVKKRAASDAVKKRAAKLKAAPEGSLSDRPGIYDEEWLAEQGVPAPVSGSADRPAAGSTSTPPADSGSDTLNTAIRHLQSGGAAVFTGTTLAASLSKFFLVLGWVVVGLSVIGGIVLMVITEPDPLSRYDEHHPYVIEGVIVLVSGSIQGFVLVMLGSFVQATLEFQSLVGGFFKRLKTLSL